MESRYMLSIAVAFIAVAAQAAELPEFTPVKDGGELVLFDAATSDDSVIRHYTHGRHKGHDLVPEVKPVVKGGQKFLDFTYRGKRGHACSTFWYENVPKPDDGMQYTGIRFTIDYDKDDYAKVSAKAQFNDGTGVGLVLTLEPGCRDYAFRSGYRRARTPIKWDELRYMWLSASDIGGKGNRLNFRLRRAVMEQKKLERGSRKLEVGSIRKEHEVFPVRGALTIDGKLNDEAWRHCAELASLWRYHGGGDIPAAESPYRVRVTHDNEKIYIATQSEFPTEPVSREMRRDGSVYGDEAQEFLFSGPNDNTQKVQFVFNRAGTIFDCAVEYDLVAAGIRTKIDKSIKHEKAHLYANGLWTTEIAFPFSELQVDLGKQRHMRFQVAQYYIARKEKKLRTMVWDRTSRFPDVPNFGVLVFNKQPFGPGTVEISGIERLDRKDGTADFLFDCTFKGFLSGAYKAEWFLVRGRHEGVRETLTFEGERDTRKTLKVPAAENRTGSYTLTLTLVNTGGDARVCVMNFRNETDVPDLFGEPLLTPRPKRIQWRDGEFPARQHARLYLDRAATPRTRRTAALFAEDYFAHTGIRLKTLPAAGTPSDGIVLRVAEAARYDGKPAKPHREGYVLSVEKNQISITGFDEPGLYYGTVTLFQMMKHSMKVREQMPVRCAEAYDWPDLPNRMVSSQGQSGFRNQTPRDNFGIQYIMEWVDRFVAGNKGNVMYWDLSSRVKYKRQPEFNGSERMYSLEDLKRFADFCRDRFVEVCPAWQVGGHANWWLLGYHPEMREKGYWNQADVTHPDHNKVVFNCMLDVIEALGCKYASPKSDEWWGKRKADETADELLNGKTRAQAFLDFHVRLNDFLKSRGVTMLMYHDMLTPYHNGKKFDLYKIVPRFPRDVIIQYWGGNDKEKGVAWFAERGFAVWIHATGDWILHTDESKRMVTGAGKILYSLGNDKLGDLLDRYSQFNNVYSALRMLDYAWNIHDYKKPEEAREVTIKNILALKPNPYAGEKLEPLDIGAQLTDRFNARLKEFKPKDYGRADTPVVLEPGTHDFGFIPMRIEPEKDGNCLVRREGDEPVSIPVDARYSSLVFLHTAFINNPKDKRAKAGMSRYWLYGWPCGDYIVHYEDGETERLAVRLTMNIRRFDTKSNNRATNENRYVHALKDANQNNVHLFQWEWVNPHPEKRITKVEVRHDNELDVSLILFAISGRSVWMP